MSSPGKSRPAWEFRDDRAEWLTSYTRALLVNALERSVLESGDGRRCAWSDPSTVQRNATRRPSRVPNNLREMVEG